MIRILLAALLALAPAAVRAEGLRCGPFPASDPHLAPIGRNDSWWVTNLKVADEALKARPYAVWFLGDSLTEGWDKPLWEDHFARRGAINLGFGGDRTEHLLWRLQQHHLAVAAAAPRLVVMLIGTNDVGHGRPPAEAAEGVRRNLALLRARLPQARILLLGLPPRSELPTDPLRVNVGEVNRLIAGCADGQTVIYADIGQPLLDGKGHLTQAVSPDRLHFNARGYGLLASQLDRLLDRLGAPPA